MTATSDRLGGDLGWGLAAVFRGFLTETDAVAEDLPGGRHGYQVLSAAAGGEPASQAAMTLRLGIDKTVMTYLLDDMEAASLVERQADPADRRSRLITATPHGRQVLSYLDERLARAEQRLLAGLDAADQAELRRLLRAVAAHESD
ncbi:MAG TPA: MarR family transcriptional regulator [Actinospica sp.]|jgi:DNA-binding MarR family transcriptional regulator|nr:MarR family transcriptional regulator [Actinospica sp.]